MATTEPARKGLFMDKDTSMPPTGAGGTPPYITVEQVLELAASRALSATEPRYERIETQLYELNEKYHRLDKNIDMLNEKYNTLDKKIDGLDKKVGGLTRNIWFAGGAVAAAVFATAIGMYQVFQNHTQQIVEQMDRRYTDVIGGVEKRFDYRMDVFKESVDELKNLYIKMDERLQRLEGKQ